MLANIKSERILVHINSIVIIIFFFAKMVSRIYFPQSSEIFQMSRIRKLYEIFTRIRKFSSDE